MSTAIPSVIKVFYKFLDSDLVKIEDVKEIGDILKLPIYSFKFLDKKQAKILEDLFEIFDIHDASILTKDNPFESLIKLKSTDDPIKATVTREKLKKKIEELKEKFPKLEDNLKKIITISSIIQEIKDETKEIEKEKQKIIVVGLDNAGKTALLSRFGSGLGIGDLASLKPTKGVERKEAKMKGSSDLEIVIWDFGGQEIFRKTYLSNPEKYFIQIDLLIYVIDVQDTDRFEESLEYFEKILETLKMLEENPYILVFIHKYDPDLKRDSTVLLSVELLKDSLEDLFKNENVDFEIYLTSIYSLISSEPDFSRYIKDIMKSKNALTDPTVKKLDGFAKILEENMNLVIRLSESLSLQLNEIDNRLRAIESGAFYLAEAGIPVELKTPMQIQESKEVREGNVRSQVLNELKDLFAKKKSLE